METPCHFKVFLINMKEIISIFIINMDLIVALLLLFIMFIICYKVQKSFFRTISFLSLFFFAYMMILLILDDLMVAAALIIGLTALLKSLIFKYFFPPILKLSIRKIDSIPQQELIKNKGSSTKWLNLSIKNTGLSYAKNIQAKIRENNNVEWISLMRPFQADLARQNIKNLEINLSSKEDEDFNIGYILKEGYSDNLIKRDKNIFYIYTNIEPYNQAMCVRESSKEFNLKITGENLDTLFFKLKIKHDNFDKFNKDNIEIIKI